MSNRTQQRRNYRFQQKQSSSGKQQEQSRHKAVKQRLERAKKERENELVSRHSLPGRLNELFKQTDYLLDSLCFLGKEIATKLVIRWMMNEIVRWTVFYGETNDWDTIKFQRKLQSYGLCTKDIENIRSELIRKTCYLLHWINVCKSMGDIHYSL